MVLRRRTSTCIGTEFHRWVRDHEDRLGLEKSSDFVRFIDRDFAFYGHWYERLRNAADSLTPGLECVYFNAEHNFTLQYPVLLSPLRVAGLRGRLLRKIRVTAAFLDILIHRRIWNWRAIDYSTMQYAMFIVMRDIRGKMTAELVSLLRQRLDVGYRDVPQQPSLPPARDERTSDSSAARTNDGVHRDTVRHALALRRVREARWRTGSRSSTSGPITTERHDDEFAHPSEFAEYRNRIGGLLLLPKSFNASYGDLPYEEKLRALRQPEPAGTQLA